ncbi:MAG: ribonuclease, Rne/Rng family [Burkholderiales bacterium]|jgi:ribonuclease E|nr:ribonuclease, Rne/Rng family [Burkholderiales bacterium]
MKRMLFNATYQEELRVATVEGQRLINFDIETSSKTQRRGNIYKGVITRVESSLEACFVDYGTEKQGFLPFKEIDPRYLPDTGRTRDLSKLHVGLELIIQVEKDERGNKGAALTTFVSLPGRYLVLMPNSSRSGGISRRIDGEEREELKEALSQVEVPDGMSIIARTAALGRIQKELQWDLNYLCNLWEAITTAAQNNKGSFLIYQESSLVIRSIRDHFSPDISEILIDMEDIFDQAKQFMAHVMPTFVDRVKFYHDDVPLFSRFQIEHQIESAYGRMVNLPSGGSIAIDHTEALTAIDVNSAKANKGSDIEATAFSTNLEAAEEVARQLRLRDLGGLVVVDFIDMENMRNQREVENHFKQQLGLDRARIQMGKLSKFGLLELSRQRLSASLEESTTITCPRCEGIGSIRGIESSSIHILRIIQEEAVKGHSYLSALHVQLPVTVATYLLNEKRDDVAKIENRLKIKVILIPNIHLESPHYKIRKVSQDSMESLTSKVSYNLVENAEETALNYQGSGKAGNKLDAKAMVKNITPAHPAPTIPSVSAIGGFFAKIGKMLKKLLSSEDKPLPSANTNNNRRDQRQNNRHPKGNRTRPVGQNRSNHKIQTVRPQAPRSTESAQAPQAERQPSPAPRNVPNRGNQAEGKPENNRNDRKSSPRSGQNDRRQQQSFTQKPIETPVSNPQATTNPTPATKPPVNQEWQETKPIIVVKDEAPATVAATPTPATVPEKAVEEVVKKEVKPVVNTITQPVDLGALQMVATDQDLVKNIVVPVVHTDINTKRFNDVTVDKPAPRNDDLHYELVETKHS